MVGLQPKVRPEDRIQPGAFDAPVMRQIIGKGAEPEPLLCRLCKFLGNESCPHRVVQGADPPAEARKCNSFLVNAATHGDVERLVIQELLPDPSVAA